MHLEGLARSISPSAKFSLQVITCPSYWNEWVPLTRNWENKIPWTIQGTVKIDLYTKTKGVFNQKQLLMRREWIWYFSSQGNTCLGWISWEQYGAHFRDKSKMRPCLNLFPSLQVRGGGSTSALPSLGSQLETIFSGVRLGCLIDHYHSPASRTEGACLLRLSGYGFLGKNVNPKGCSLCPNHPLSVWSLRGAEGESISPLRALVPHLKDRNNNFVILTSWHCSEVWLNETQSLSGPMCIKPSVAK